MASLVPFGKEITKVAIASQLPMRENYNNCGLAEHKAVDLLEMLQRERQYGRLSGCRQVNLITHSHGSLVTRAMLDLARRESREDAELAANVIYNAPPFGGSTLAHFDTLFLVNDELSADVFDDVLLNKAFAHTSNTLGGMLRLYTDRLVRAFGITGDAVFGALPEPILDALAELDEDYPTQFDGIDVLADELRPAGEAFTGVVKLIRPVITHLTGLPGSPAAEQDLSFEGGLAHLTRYETSPYVKQFVTLGRGGFDAWTFPNLSDVAANPQALINPARHLVGEDDDAVPAGSARLLTQTDAFGPRMTLLGEFATFSHGDLIYGRAVNIGDSGGIGTLWLETLLAAPTSLLLTGEVEFADDATRHYVVASAAAFSFSSESVSARDVEVSATGHEYRVLTGARGQAIPKPWTPVDLGEQVFFGDLCAEQDLVPGVTFELEWRSVNARGGYEIIRSASITVSGDAPVLLPPSGPGVIATRAFSKVRNDRQTMRSTSGLTGAADLANTAVGEPDLIVRTQALDTLRMPAIKARDVTARWEVGIQQSIQARIELPRIAMPKNLSEGIHTLHLELDAGTDDAGKAEIRSARVLRVRVDNTPPRVSLEGVPTLAPRDERQPAVVGPNTPLSLLAFDDGCGSARGQVTAGRANDPFPIGTVFTPRDILGSDKHTHGFADRDRELTLTAAVQDPVGNAAQHRVQIRVDATPPRIEAVNIQGGKPRAESIVVSETRVAVDFRASDQLAGVDRAEVCVIKPHQGLAPPTRCRTLREPERFGTTVELDPGRNILLICAYDLVGNATTKLIVLDCNAEEAPRTEPPGWFKDVRSQVRGARGVLSITLTRPAPRTGLTLLLISSHPAVVGVPELFPVPAEATTIRVPFLVRNGTKMAGMRITLQIDNSEYSVDIGASGGEDR